MSGGCSYVVHVLELARLCWKVYSQCHYTHPKFTLLGSVAQQQNTVLSDWSRKSQTGLRLGMVLDCSQADMENILEGDCGGDKGVEGEKKRRRRESEEGGTEGIVEVQTLSVLELPAHTPTHKVVQLCMCASWDALCRTSSPRDLCFHQLLLCLCRALDNARLIH